MTFIKLKQFNDKYAYDPENKKLYSLIGKQKELSNHQGSYVIRYGGKTIAVTLATIEDMVKYPDLRSEDLISKKQIKQAKLDIDWNKLPVAHSRFNAKGKRHKGWTQSEINSALKFRAKVDPELESETNATAESPQPDLKSDKGMHDGNDHSDLNSEKEVYIGTHIPDHESVDPDLAEAPAPKSKKEDKNSDMLKHVADHETEMKIDELLDNQKRIIEDVKTDLKSMQWISKDDVNFLAKRGVITITYPVVEQNNLVQVIKQALRDLCISSRITDSKIRMMSKFAEFHYNWLFNRLNEMQDRLINSDHRIREMLDVMPHGKLIRYQKQAVRFSNELGIIRKLYLSCLHDQNNTYDYLNVLRRKRSHKIITDKNNDIHAYKESVRKFELIFDVKEEYENNLGKELNKAKDTIKQLTDQKSELKDKLVTLADQKSEEMTKINQGSGRTAPDTIECSDSESEKSLSSSDDGSDLKSEKNFCKKNKCSDMRQQDTNDMIAKDNESFVSELLNKNQKLTNEVASLSDQVALLKSYKAVVKDLLK